MYEELGIWCLPELALSDEARAQTRHLLALVDELGWDAQCYFHPTEPRYRLRIGGKSEDSVVTQCMPLDAANLSIAIELLTLVVAEKRRQITETQHEHLSALEERVARLEKTLHIAGPTASGQGQSSTAEGGSGTQTPQEVVSWEALNQLALQAGGYIDQIEADDAVEDYEGFWLRYHRYQRLKTATLTTFVRREATYRSHAQGIHSYGFNYCFLIPLRYDQLHELLLNDIEVYRRLPEEAKRPAGWSEKHK